MKKAQSSLFSFFKKAPTAPVSAMETSPTVDIKTSHSVETSTEKVVATPANCQGDSDWDQKIKGRRISIYWVNDNEWYPGVIQDYDQSTNEHVIKYDDGVIEKLLLSNEKFRFIADKNANKQDEILSQGSKMRKVVMDDDSNESKSSSGMMSKGNN